MNSRASGRRLLMKAAREGWTLFSAADLEAVMRFITDRGDDEETHQQICGALINAMPSVEIRRQIKSALLESARLDRSEREQLEGSIHDEFLEARARARYKRRGSG